MKVTYVFDYDNEDDVERHEIFKHSLEMQCAISEICEVLRRYRKYEELTNEEVNLFDRIDAEIIGIFQDRNIGDII